MELELGLKFTRAVDEFTSDFRIAKDRAGTLFLSRETDTIFVLTAHLKGYKRSNIRIDINEDGSLIGISGEKQVKETVMVGWKVYKKEAEVKGFKKVFRIPDGVILDKIEAKFNEDESSLTIIMPKKVKGIRGTCIEEVKEEQELVKEGSGNFEHKGEKLKAKDGEEGGPFSRKQDMENQTKVDEIEERIETKKDQEVDVRENEDVDSQRKVEEIEENIENKKDQEVDRENDVLENEDVESERKVEEIEEKVENKEDQQVDKENDAIENEERFDEEKVGHVEKEEECGKMDEKKCKMCLPIVAGSTLLLSFVVFVIQIIRSKNRNSTRKN